MSSSNCWFLMCIQVSQEAGKMIWYFHLLRNFPQFVVIHTVKGLSVVNKAKVDIFLEFFCFLYDPKNAGNLISGFSAFSKPTFYICKFLVHVLPRLKDAEHYLASMWNEHTSDEYSEQSLALPFFGIGMKTDLFQACDNCWVFQIC